jgi:crotonobetainyl-CoA:carnitine CoA-transferase CaiB-like acyl-CoA transferase
MSLALTGVRILDLKTVEGKAIFHDLCDNADVLVESFAPGTTEYEHPKLG